MLIKKPFGKANGTLKPFLGNSLWRPPAPATVLCMDLHLAKGDHCSAVRTSTWTNNQPPVAPPLMLLNLVKREQLGAAMVPALMRDLLSNRKGQQALALAHGTPAGRTVHPSLTLQLVQAGDTNQVTLGAAGYRSFPWCRQAHRALH